MSCSATLGATPCDVNQTLAAEPSAAALRDGDAEGLRRLGLAERRMRVLIEPLDPDPPGRSGTRTAASRR
jgi:hypothetical protein